MSGDSDIEDRGLPEATGSDSFADEGGGPPVPAGFESLPTPLSGTGLGAVLDAETLAKVRRVVVDGTPANTRRAYAADLRYFSVWRDVSGFEDVWPVPPEILIRFVVEQVEGTSPTVEDAMLAQGVKRTPGIQAWSTIGRRVAAIATAHRTKGLASPTAHPTVMEIVARAKRACVARGWSPKRKAAADREVLERLLDTCGTGLVGIRDRAILLFGFSTGGRRRSEISEATFERLQRVGRDYVYRMGRTKTTQDGTETPVPVTGRAAMALARWIALAGIQEGPLFRAVWDETEFVSPEAISDRTVARMIKRRAELAGFDPENFGGHSLRSGFLTQAGINGVSLAEAMSLSTHKDVNTAVIYYRAGEVLSVAAGRMMEGGERAAEAESDIDAIMAAAAAARNRTADTLSSPGPAPAGPEAAVRSDPATDDDYFGEPATDGVGDPEDGSVLDAAAAEDEEALGAAPSPGSEKDADRPAAGASVVGQEPREPSPARESRPELAAFRPSFLD